MLPAHGRVLGHSLLAFHHQEELPPQRGSGHLPLPKLQFVVLPLECREPEGMGGGLASWGLSTPAWGRLWSLGLSTQGTGTSLGVRRAW